MGLLPLCRSFIPLVLPKLSEKTLLIITVLVAGLCSIVYELLISTTSAYFLGDSVKQFSLTIGTYMFAMGVGSFLSQYVRERELTYFVGVEIVLGLCGGFSVPLLYLTFPDLDNNQFQYLTLLLTFVIGLLTGYEIPLLARIMKKYYPLRSNLANVLGIDYLGALVATLLFPFILLPFLGLFRSSLLFGAVNVFLGLGIYFFFAERLSSRAKQTLFAAAVGVLLLFGLLWSRADKMLGELNAAAYPHPVIYGEQTPYQQLTLTQNNDDLRLYLDRVIQFSSKDEYRYHESLALIPAAVAGRVNRALILGGGEGLLARELLKLPELQELHIVDLDEKVFDLARRHAGLVQLNKDALRDPRVTTHPEDAAIYLRNDEQSYDLILADLPDPGNESIARLYSDYFFNLARRRLTTDGVFATQATSPYHTSDAFWCINTTLYAAGFNETYPYRVNVPSFGLWGFVMATQRPIDPEQFRADVPTRFLDTATVNRLFEFPPDLKPTSEYAVNRLDRPVLLDYFLADWSKWQREKAVH
ncbi:hypothetical protein CEQ90_18985 [Lewinellaceae bacterium SD302]|nr:hypothetical protein CEQ90_18985 [Lewinellaceae bacterium SD302]